MEGSRVRAELLQKIRTPGSWNKKDFFHMAVVPRFLRKDDMLRSLVPIDCIRKGGPGGGSFLGRHEMGTSASLSISN